MIVIPKQWVYIQTLYDTKDIAGIYIELKSIRNILDSYSNSLNSDDRDYLKEKKHLLYDILDEIEKREP